MKAKKQTLGIDLGGTFVKYGLVDRRFRLTGFNQIPTPPTEKELFKLFVEIIGRHSRSIDRIGIGIPGSIDRRSGKIIKTPNLMLFQSSLVNKLKKLFRQPIKIENDANCSALAEAIVGSGKNYNSVVGLILGSGVGGGIVINKKLYLGHGAAGEIGHQIIDYKNLGDLESFAGAKKMGLTGDDYHRLARAARSGNARALKFWSDLGCALGIGCANITRFLDQELIVIGGKTARFFPLFYPSLIKSLKSAYSKNLPLPKIIKSKLIDRSGIIGAALLNYNFK